MKSAFTLLIASFLAFSLSQAGYAQTPAPKAATTEAKPDASTIEAKKAKAKECSDQADAQKLHGKARRDFRAKCKKN